MQVIPAIDLRGGHCVRLRQGDFDQETVFGDDPAAIAMRWESEGAERIHLVDLDGAKSGQPVNVEAVEAIVERGASSLSARWRNSRPSDDCRMARCRTRTCRRRDASAARSGLVWPDGRGIRRAGWFWASMRLTAAWRLRAGSTCRACRRSRWRGSLILSPWRRSFIPISRVTARSKDPTCRRSPQWPTRCESPVIASGGVGDLQDLERLAALPIAGCIVGRALYEGRFSLAGAIERCAAIRPAVNPDSQ